MAVTLVPEVAGVSVQRNGTTLIDEVSSSLTYIGKAAAGSGTASAVWQILRLSVTGGLTSLEYADGDPAYDNVWDDRASLNYS